MNAPLTPDEQLTPEQKAQFEARVNELVAGGLDHRVARDQAGAEMIREEERCERCGGTDNELMFMFRRCTECYGTGKRRKAT